MAMVAAAATYIRSNTTAAVGATIAIAVLAYEVAVVAVKQNCE